MRPLDGMGNHKVGYKEMKAGFHKSPADTQCWSQHSWPGLWSLSLWSGGGAGGTLCPAYSTHSPFPVGAVVWPLSEEPCEAPKPISQSSFCSGSWSPPQSPGLLPQSCTHAGVMWWVASPEHLELWSNSIVLVLFRRAGWWWLQGTHPLYAWLTVLGASWSTTSIPIGCAPSTCQESDSLYLSRYHGRVYIPILWRTWVLLPSIPTTGAEKNPCTLLPSSEP